MKINNKFIFLLSISLSAFAESKPPAFIGEIGVQGTRFDYREYDEKDQILDSEESKIDGVKGYWGALKFKTGEGMVMGNANYLEIKAEELKGKTDCIGSYIGSGLGYGSLKSVTENKIYEVEVNFYEMEYAEKHMSYIYGGLGYRQWNRELTETQLEKYRWVNVVLGVGGETEVVEDRIRIGMDGALKMSVFEEMKAELPSFNETFKLGGVTTLIVGIPVVFHLNESFDFIVRGEYEYIKIEKSDVINGFYEPDSETKNFNLMASVRASF